jgi:hypothetical protein
LDSNQELRSGIESTLRQRREISQEIDSIFEVLRLEMMEEARFGRHDPAADAARFHL